MHDLVCLVTHLDTYQRCKRQSSSPAVPKQETAVILFHPIMWTCQCTPLLQRLESCLLGLSEKKQALATRALLDPKPYR
jgi:hypothetical protein